MKGTKYGVSAASYPYLDIVSLTLDDAKALYVKDFWAKIGGDSLGYPLNLVVFDAAVNFRVTDATNFEGKSDVLPNRFLHQQFKVLKNNANFSPVIR